MRLSFSKTAAKDRAHPHTISLKLRDTNQLFNSMDPSPFIEKDLDDDAEEFIVSWAQEFSPDAAIKLRIHLDQLPAEDSQEMIRTAAHNHFAHRAQITELEFKRLLKQGRTRCSGVTVPARRPHSFAPILPKRPSKQRGCFQRLAVVVQIDPEDREFVEVTAQPCGEKSAFSQSV